MSSSTTGGEEIFDAPNPELMVPTAEPKATEEVVVAIADEAKTEITSAKDRLLMQYRYYSKRR